MKNQTWKKNFAFAFAYACCEHTLHFQTSGRVTSMCVIARKGRSVTVSLWWRTREHVTGRAWLSLSGEHPTLAEVNSSFSRFFIKNRNYKKIRDVILDVRKNRISFVSSFHIVKTEVTRSLKLVLVTSQKGLMSSKNWIKRQSWSEIVNRRKRRE